MAQSHIEPSAAEGAWKSWGLHAALIVVVTLVAYIPAMRGGFIWDDDVLIIDNQMVRGADGLYRFWFTTEAPDYWPLTSSVWWLEWRLWGGHAMGYHVVNVLLHAANAVLVWMILRQLNIPGAWWAGLLFAIHPVNVATVAWISEQKNTLSMFFYAVAILLYLRFDEEGQRWSYVLSLTAFLLALLSKAAVVMLPIVLMGCVWWLRGRVQWRDFLRIGPFIALSLILGMVTMWFQHNRALVLGGLTVPSGNILSRAAVAGCAVWFSLFKAVLPFNLSMIYPRWNINASLWVSYLPGILLLGCFALFWWKRKTWGRPLLFAQGYYVVMLFPVLGFVYISFHVFSLAADHWQYSSIPGVTALVAAAGVAIYRRTAGWRLPLAAYATAVILMALGVATWERSSIYATSESLWRDTVAKNPKAWIAHYNLGNALAQKGMVQDAIEHYEQALEIKPDYRAAHNNIAFALFQAGRVDDAIAHLEQVVRIDPDSVEGHYNLGNAFMQTGRFQNAMEHYEQAVRLRPDFAEAHRGLGVLLARQGRTQEAVNEYLQALRYRPDDPEALNYLSLALASQRKLGEAVAQVEAALRLNPDYADAHYSLAIFLVNQGKTNEATSHLQRAVKLEPNSERYRHALDGLQRIMAQPKTQ